MQLTCIDISDNSMAAEVLAGAICDQLGVKYMGTLGRGFQLHACCDALEAHFSK